MGSIAGFLAAGTRYEMNKDALCVGMSLGPISRIASRRKRSAKVAWPSEGDAEDVREKTALNMNERLWRTSSAFRPTLYISRLRQTPASGRARLSPRRSSIAALIISMKETGPCSVLVPKRLRKSCKNCIERFTR